MEEVRNTVRILCPACGCLLLREDKAVKVEVEYQIPNDQGEAVSERLFWRVDDVMAFDNIAVSKEVNSQKLLTCAECERSILGAMDLPSRTCFLCCSRVRERSRGG